MMRQVLTFPEGIGLMRQSMIVLVWATTCSFSFAQQSLPQQTPSPQIAANVPMRHITLTVGSDAPAPMEGEACPQDSVTYVDPDLFVPGGSGLIVGQGGFVEGEIAAVSYTLPAAAFPVEIDAAELVFFANTTVQTTTQFTVMFWEGTPDAGDPDVFFTSGGDFLPPLVIEPSAPAGIGVVLRVEFKDIFTFLLDDDGSQTITVGFRINNHHQPGPTACVPPDSCCNAFPSLDDGLDVASENWWFALDCGPPPFFCPGGWHRFSEWLCEPSGDWAIRALFIPDECDIGACCQADETCSNLSEAQCLAAGGAYEGAGTICDGPCTVACCFGDSCVDFSQDDCMSAGGMGQGVGTACVKGECPLIEGACCFNTGFCNELDMDTCLVVGAKWLGPLSSCVDSDGDGSEDDCPGSNCPGDTNSDGVVNVQDLVNAILQWGTNDPGADVTGDGTVNVSDLVAIILAWGPC